jgi:hypothetical protein
MSTRFSDAPNVNALAPPSADATIRIDWPLANGSAGDDPPVVDHPIVALDLVNESFGFVMAAHRVEVLPRPAASC